MAGKKRNARSRRHGRHHKVPPPHTTGQWLRVGVVTAGLGAAIAAGQGVAGASPGDDSGSSGTESSGSASGSGSTNAPDTSTQDPDGAATMQASLSEEDSDTDTAPAANEVSAEQTGDGQFVAEVIDADEDAGSGPDEAVDLDTEPRPAPALGEQAQIVDVVADSDAGSDAAGVIDVDTEPRSAAGLDADADAGSAGSSGRARSSGSDPAERAEEVVSAAEPTVVEQDVPADLAVASPVPVSDGSSSPRVSSVVLSTPQPENGDAPVAEVSKPVVESTSLRSQLSSPLSLDKQASGDGPVTPGSAPLMWGAAAVARREAGVNATAGAFRLFGDGTVENPNAGLLFGNGFSWDAASCTGTTACDGGDGGLFGGSGGNGFNGGNGGSGGLFFGRGGNGGAGVPGGDGGNGGSGGLFFGSGGRGGDGGAALVPGGAGGQAGSGGTGGLFGTNGQPGQPGTEVVVPTNPPSLTQLARVDVGESPVDAAVSPDGTKVYVANFWDASLSVIDTSTRAVTTINDVGGKPFSVAVSPDSKYVYVASQDRDIYYDVGTLSIIDAATNTVTKTLDVGREPGAVATSPDGTRVYVLNIHGESFNVEEDQEVVGSVTVIDAQTNTVLSTVAVGRYPEHLVVSPDSGTVYVTDLGALGGGPSGITLIDTASLQVTDTIAVGTNPGKLALNPDGTQLFVNDWSQNEMRVIDTRNNTVSAPIDGPTWGLTVSPDGKYVYAVDKEPVGSVYRGIAVIDTATNTVVSTTDADLGLWDVALSPDGHTLYAVSPDTNEVTVFDTTSGRGDETGNHAPYGLPEDRGGWVIDSYTGQVAARADFVDPDGDTLTYALTVPPDRASGSVAFEDATGMWIFTPTVEARNRAYGTDGDNTAAFTVTASDGVAHTSLVVTVPIAPLEPLSLDRSTPTQPAVVHYIPIGRHAASNLADGVVAVSPDGKYAYVGANHDGRGSYGEPVNDFVHPVLSVVDTGTGEVIAEIHGSGMDGIGSQRWGRARGVVASPDGDRVYVGCACGDYSHGGDYAVSVVDTATHTVVAEIPLGDYPLNETYVSNQAGITYLDVSPDGSRLYAQAADADTGFRGIAVIDTATNSVIERIAVDGVSGVDVSSDGGRLLVTSRPQVDDGSYATLAVVVIDTGKDTVLDEIPVSDVFIDALGSDVTGYIDPETGVGLSPDGNTIYLARYAYPPDVTEKTNLGNYIYNPSSIVTVIDAKTGDTITHVALGDGSYSDFGVEVIHELPNEDSGYAADFAVEASPDGNFVYVTSTRTLSDGAVRGVLSKIDARTNTLVGEVLLDDTGIAIQKIAVSGDGSRVYVTGRALDGSLDEPSDATDYLITLSVIDAAKFPEPADGPSGPPVVDVTESPASIPDLYEHLRTVTQAAPNGVYIETIRDQWGDPHLVVYLGGTTLDIDNQFPLKNFPSYSGVVDDAQIRRIDAAVEIANAQQTVLTETPILLVGYSQGGMDAQNIAASGRYAVTSVITFASPIIRRSSGTGVNYNNIHLWAEGDPIPQFTFPQYTFEYNNANEYGHVFESDPNSDKTLFDLHADWETYKNVGQDFEDYVEAHPDGKYKWVNIDIGRYLNRPLIAPESPSAATT